MATKVKNVLNLEENPYYKMSLFDIEKYTTEFWDVSETISELSYLTHSYFRYYGKFPSKIGRLIVEDLDERGIINPESDFILDNYAGSGTTLVEAKLKNYDSYGIDINPFAVLACKVKTRNYDIKELEDYWGVLYNEIQSYNHVMFPESDNCLLFVEPNDDIVRKIRSTIERFKSDNADALKWFSEDAIIGLSIIKELLLIREHSELREFFELAFFAIIRRVSTAHDGEVRPHANPKKRKRNVAEAYSKKVVEMIELMDAWNSTTQKTCRTNAVLCNNANQSEVNSYIETIERQTGKQLGLVVSHPPYLNCFDYIPVFRLKFLWVDGFADIMMGETYKSIKDMEIKSYPASTEENIEKYFEHNKKVYTAIFNKLRKGGYCCIVIGDCTVKEKLFEVHKTFITMLEEIGFCTEKIAYRSTAYGIGQYAYRHRADYNEDANRKKDGVLFLYKP